ncbi:MAG: GNAT family N-acetyltransferase [Acidobacteriota bacterium]
MPTLETERLVLRMFRESDLDAYAEMCGDPQVMRYINAGQPLSREEAWRHMAMVLGHWQLRGYGLWAAVEKQSDTLVGRVGCWNPEGWPGVEVGWMLRRSFWGRGLATEAARTALNFAFTTLKSERIISVIHPGNRPSIRVAERLGEQFERMAVVRGVEALIYGISRQEWEGQNSE